MISSYRAFFRHAADGCLRYDHGVAECQSKKNVDQQKNSAAVFCCQIRETPDISQSYRSTRSGKHEPELSGEAASLFMIFAHKVLQLIKLSF